MIRAITIQNFLSHKKTKLEFSKGLNVIVGQTDSGKSAIIRALRWVITNKPGGDSFRSNWGGDTEVLLEFFTQWYTSRIKSNRNLYELDGVELEGFGSSVPDEIREELNIDVLNLQTQFETHFLLGKSPGEIAAYFNRIAGLDKSSGNLILTVS